MQLVRNPSRHGRGTRARVEYGNSINRRHNNCPGHRQAGLTPFFALVDGHAFGTKTRHTTGKHAAERWYVRPRFPRPVSHRRIYRRRGISGRREWVRGQKLRARGLGVDQRKPHGRQRGADGKQSKMPPRDPSPFQKRASSLVDAPRNAAAAASAVVVVAAVPCRCCCGRCCSAGGGGRPRPMNDRLPPFPRPPAGGEEAFEGKVCGGQLRARWPGLRH